MLPLVSFGDKKTLLYQTIITVLPHCSLSISPFFFCNSQVVSIIFFLVVKEQKRTISIKEEIPSKKDPIFPVKIHFSVPQSPSLSAISARSRIT